MTSSYGKEGVDSWVKEFVLIDYHPAVSLLDRKIFKFSAPGVRLEELR